ncbi:serine hydrolase domain-containing protein [Nocardia yamanashiensis]|uniref:serine hydrolase domain-containing protein n=1 Tax=Nocardia yamanashiensis TaxID=209247 RepID=UPI00082A2A0F|nr:serine hydrolase domain-containing protein [Nocardia yamanashiensis]
MRTLRGYRGRIALAGIGMAATLAAAACSTEVSASEPGKQQSQTLNEAVEAAARTGFPGIQVVVSGPDGTRTLTAGAGDVSTGAPFPDNSQVRIGSNTKTFVSTVILQLVAEGKIDLDAPIEKYLPGVVAGNGNDGNRISVRQLLQHTSGLPDYLTAGPADPRWDPSSPMVRADTEQARWTEHQPADLVRVAMSMPPQFEPGAKSVYTNTNYILAGMLIDRVTGSTYAEQIRTRILEPLGLRDTYFPEPRETGIRGPHAHGYQKVDGQRVDWTEQNTSWGGAAGAMISTAADLNRFFTALTLEGKLLPAAQLAEMQKTVSFDRMPGAGYGLGLIKLPSTCGKTVWGHGGSIPGFGTRNGVASDGTAVVVTVNELLDSEAGSVAVQQVFDAALCGR